MKINMRDLKIDRIIYIIVPENFKPGQLLEFKSEINDITRIQPFIEKFYIKIEEEIKKKTKNTPTGNRKKSGKDNEPGEKPVIIFKKLLFPTPFLPNIPIRSPFLKV